jgi:hypothetical protein
VRFYQSDSAPRNQGYDSPPLIQVTSRFRRAMVDNKYAPLMEIDIE